MEVFSNFKLLEQKSEERALVYLYESLIDLNVKGTEEFLDSIDKNLLSSNSIVHILNALSPKKNEIKNWSDFVKTAEEKLIELEREEKTKDLMKVII